MEDHAVEPSESMHDDVYGTTFARYSDSELEQFLAPFSERLVNNGLSPHSLFGGKTVLDAGCGGGRGALLALRSGAAFVDAVDVSQTNVQTTSNLLSRDFSNFSVQEGSLADLPFETGAFDLVWCNGVLMHTMQPSRVLPEIIRVLRTNGLAWLYVYGRGGIYWQVIASFRRVFSSPTPQQIIDRLVALNLPNGRIAEMIDDWKAPFLRTYRAKDLTGALTELGCTSRRLMRGTEYDTSEQLERGINPELMGEGDLRFLVKKEVATPVHLSSSTRSLLDGSHLDESSVAKGHEEASSVAVDIALAQFEKHWNHDPIGAIEEAMKAQIFLRDVFLKSPTPSAVSGLVSLLG